MEAVKLRNMLYLQRTKTKIVVGQLFFLLLLVTSSLSSIAQKEIYREEQDSKPYYFGLTLSTVYSRFQIEHHPSFLQQDTALVSESINSPGISLRLVAALNLTN